MYRLHNPELSWQGTKKKDEKIKINKKKKGRGREKLEKRKGTGIINKYNQKN